MIQYMNKRFLYTCLFLLNSFAVQKAAAQDSADIEYIYPVSSLSTQKFFTYRVLLQEYLTNENGYYLGATNDTIFLRFDRLNESGDVYRMRYGLDEACTKPVPGDSIRKMLFEVEFDENGKVKQLRNWKKFRDYIVAGYSAQVRAKIITSSEFDEMKNTVNNEVVVRRMVMEDINYLFYLSGDTFRADAEYLRVKAVRSPFSGLDYYIQGSLKMEKPPGTKNTLIFKSENLAGPPEKQALMQEAMDYMKGITPKGQPVSEIKRVGLNSEQLYQYNTAQKRYLRATFSDVLTADYSSRGNIRIFELWDLE